MLNKTQIQCLFLNNLYLNNKLWTLIVLFVLCLSFTISCKKQDNFNTEIALTMAIDSIQLIADSSEGYFKYHAEPDGYADFSIRTFDMFYKGGNDSVRIALEKVMTNITRCNFPDFIEGNEWKLLFNDKSNNYRDIKQFGIFHVSDLAFFNNNKTALLYFSYRCGKKCGKGYMVEYRYDANKNIWDIYGIMYLWDSNPS